MRVLSATGATSSLSPTGSSVMYGPVVIGPFRRRPRAVRPTLGPAGMPLGTVLRAWWPCRISRHVTFSLVVRRTPGSARPGRYRSLADNEVGHAKDWRFTG